MKAHHLMPLLLVGCCCLPPLRGQSNPPQTAQDAAQLKQWVSAERKLAIQGNVEAQESLGMFYYSGFGAAQDYAQAAVWFHKVAIKGDTGAQGMLGNLYLQGEGVPQNYSEAYFWLDLATANPPRMTSGIPLPTEAAKEFWEKAQKTMDQSLITDRDEAASHLTQAELIRAQERAQKWFQSHPINASTR